MRAPVIELATGHVVSVIVLDDGSQWSPPNGCVVGEPGGEIGDVWDGARYTRPADPQPSDDAMPTLSPVQIREGLRTLLGVSSSAVQSIIDAIPDPGQREMADTYWHYSQSYRRDHPLVAVLESAIGLSKAQVDAAWRQSATIE